MVFTATGFLFLFLPVTVAIYFSLPTRFRNPFLLIASLFFYAWGSGGLVMLLVVSTMVDYLAGSVIDRGKRSGNMRLARAGLILSIAVNLSMLGYFKYSNFVVDQINALGETIGVEPLAWNSVALPIGISFFTFQSMSYSIDVYTGRATRIHNLMDFALYVSLFPQLVAGPIVRFHEISGQLLQRTHSWEKVSIGMQRFAWGLAKKTLIADNAAIVANASFGMEADALGTATAWVGLVAYTIQIYFDFSGYSDMAIGLGLVFGFTFPENFRRPYSSYSMTDFWRRWHITLSNWFRDYVYIPLGGSKGTEGQTVRNLWIVFLLTGLWHGAAWTFILWGAYHGALLSIERITNQRSIDANSKSEAAVRRAIVLVLVMIGWVLFRSPSLSYAWSYFWAMLPSSGGGEPLSVPRIAFAGVVVGSMIFFASRTPIGPRIGRLAPRANTAAAIGIIAVLLPLALIRVLAGSFSPFIYFQF